MNNNNEQFKKLSFWQLINDKSIEIPIIQRDYAQGRATQEKVRENFLTTLHDALIDKETELDFIYGSENDGVFRPLDGQQRLTTLFLLYWYIAVKEDKLADAQSRLARFSYETRTSSREFCNELVANSVSFSSFVGEKDEFSKKIVDSCWFVASWQDDPTISAMLIMLNAIHKKFEDSSELWNKLIAENSPITFSYVKLEDFGLSDDLYIKMNARGQQLTDFEGFKSQFTKHIEIQKFEDDIANIEERFSHKIDTTWTDLFWKYKENNVVDHLFINFIAGISVNYYAENREDEKRIQYLLNNTKGVSPEDFPTKEAFQYLVDCFNIYVEHSELQTNLELWDYSEDQLFKEFIHYSEPQYKPRVLFYAQTIYLLKNNFNTYAYLNWLRIVRNIVENSSIEHPSDFISAISLVKELASGCADIYSYLVNNNISSGYAKEQVSEEVKKAKIITTYPNSKEIIHQTEDTKFCKGKIDFALYAIDYNDADISTFDAIKLEKIKKVFQEHLNGDDVSNDFRRALFTIRDTKFYNYWWSWLYAVLANKRRIIINIQDLNIYFKQGDYREYLKDLVLKLEIETIDDIIEKFKKTTEFTNLPNWKQRIINESNLLEYCRYHYIAIPEDESCCWLIPNQRVANSEEGKKRLKEVR